MAASIGWCIAFDHDAMFERQLAYVLDGLEKALITNARSDAKRLDRPKKSS